MNKQDIQTVLDALSVVAPADPLSMSRLKLARNLLQAALTEPSEPKPYCCYCESDNDGIRSTYFDQTCKDCVKRMTHPAPSNHLDEIAKVLHYPDCWDTAAYPTLEDAIIEAKSWAHCTNEDCQCPTKDA